MKLNPYSNRKVTKKTAQLQSNNEVQLKSSHPVYTSSSDFCKVCEMTKKKQK